MTATADACVIIASLCCARALPYRRMGATMARCELRDALAAKPSGGEGTRSTDWVCTQSGVYRRWE